MQWARSTTANREFERFAAEVTDPLTSTRNWPASGYSSATTGQAAAPGGSPRASPP